MTARDLKWRAAGLVIMAAAGVGGLLAPDGSPVIVPCFVATILGVVLLLNGKRVAVALRAELRGHCDTAMTVHLRRVEQQRRKLDQPTR